MNLFSKHDIKIHHRNTPTLSYLVTQAPTMLELLRNMEKVARSKTTVLITGESGTGKELIARGIHDLSYDNGEFVAINCGAIPEEILESELFGHEKGAFTGATSSKVGKFVQANHGTIFLDEIGEMSPRLQVKLLRVLQEKKVTPLGSNRAINFQARIIAATNKNLLEEVKEGTFREDLFYRLNVIPFVTPPLRKRKEDIPELIKHFLNIHFERRPSICSRVIDMLRNYDWPGNIRELENLIIRLGTLADNDHISVEDLPSHMRSEHDLTQYPWVSVDEINEKPAETDIFTAAKNHGLYHVLEELETDLLIDALNQTGWNKNQTAGLLKINRTTLVEKLRKRGLKKEDMPCDIGK